MSLGLRVRWPPPTSLPGQTRTRPRTGAIAGAAALLLLVAPIFQVIGPHTSTNELTLGLVMTHKRFPLDLIAAALEGLGYVAAAVVLWWLAESSEARSAKPKRWLRWLVIVGGVLYGVGLLIYTFKLSLAANSFMASGSQTYPEASALTKNALFPLTAIASQFGEFLFAVAFVLVALGAMRVGLLPRYLGFVGIAAGVLVLFPIVAIPIVACVWLAAVAVLLFGRWPSGVPPAWAQGVAVPWEPPGPRGGAQAGSGAVCPGRAEAGAAVRPQPWSLTL